VRKLFNHPCPLLSSSNCSGVEKTGRETENVFDTMAVEGLDGASDSAVDVDEVRSAVEDSESRAISRDGARAFSNRF
jgi:hypothetical protein